MSLLSGERADETLNLGPADVVFPGTSPFRVVFRNAGALSVLQVDLAHEREVTRPRREASEGV